jgi:hypothetical protein
MFTTFELTVEQFEAIRDRFFRMTNLDIRCMEPAEIRALLDMLPLITIAIQHEWSMAAIYATEQDEDDGQ